MKKILFTVVVSMGFVGCADLDRESGHYVADERVVPKSYTPPTVDAIAREAGWRFAGTIKPGGETRMGTANDFVAYDSFLEAGATLKLYGWSTGWASLHVFGAKAGTSDWEEVSQTIMSNPIDPDVESGQKEFTAPFEGHYLLLIGPVGNDTLDYLLRLECIGQCGSMVQAEGAE